jgi:hypothetical protein
MTTKKNITPRRGSAKRAAAKRGTPRVDPDVDPDVDMVVDLVAEQEKQERIGFTLPEFVEPRSEQIKRLASLLTLTGFRLSLDTAPAADSRDELKQIAHHLAEALRIARFSPLIPASLYNELADVLLNFENDLDEYQLQAVVTLIVGIAGIEDDEARLECAYLTCG